jgi:hypothetical protein
MFPGVAERKRHGFVHGTQYPRSGLAVSMAVLSGGVVKAVKKPIPVQVEFASVSSEIQTEEGPVQCASGDALMTGAAGERWPIGRNRFEAIYEPLAPTRMGENGAYLKKIETVDAQQTTTEVEIDLGPSHGTLRAKPGDWIVTSNDGHRWVVASDIFQNTYEIKT